MYQGGSPGRGGFKSSGRMRLKGLFADGIWQCNCNPRLPATHFQVKNGGKNHGRWFYTCQYSPPQRCDFFLWDDDAKTREAAAVLNNSRTEPRTPTRVHAPMTPQTSPITPSLPADTPGRSATTRPIQRSAPAEQNYEWSSSDENVLTAMADASSPVKLPLETPRKAIKTYQYSNSSKRSHDQFEHELEQGRDYEYESSRVARDLFGSHRSLEAPASPSPATRTSRLQKPEAAGLLSPGNTPAVPRLRDAFETPTKQKAVPRLAPSTPSLSAIDLTSSSSFASKFPSSTFSTPSSSTTSLTAELFNALREAKVSLHPTTSDALQTICERHVRRAQGLERGRDVSRQAIKRKDVKIAQLEQRIGALEAEIEVGRRIKSTSRTRGNPAANSAGKAREEGREQVDEAEATTEEDEEVEL